ncbi:methyltransferase domain-containing protein [Rhodoblastus acidophilus]|uniref:Methyltransferase domain-containing protein n=1 Tax=Rhodoblastus acidophilus TaxID=1074 RepID=A0A6N8DP52_RHOAC|nr:class I SAM-dependent methyltransferase [Rhodoblastus acidophilus]MCW2275601.1 ubiquinone/menaquinone biosynthesis C-methylase UbiE [Rhodoblastus acidophilus]MTV32098.1 methyltransferase domain-containing protein [Rhodoblastus acidophilus]
MKNSEIGAFEREQIGSHWDNHGYYQDAESPAWLDGFWGPRSRFARLFDFIADLSSVLELACGHGRHAAQIVDRAVAITVSDINESNIAFCRQRFASRGNVSYHVGNGHDFAGVADASMTAVFSYDAMVHFEFEDVLSYIVDLKRILRPGGQALLHYSNYTGNPGGHYRDNPHSRNFGSETVFWHMARRAGLQVLESETFNWGGNPQEMGFGIDALTLLRRP